VATKNDAIVFGKPKKNWGPRKFGDINRGQKGKWLGEGISGQGRDIRTWTLIADGKIREGEGVRGGGGNR